MICPHFGPCGGCSHQDVPYEDQIKSKEELVRSELKEFEIGKFHSIWPSPETMFYRNKMEFSFGNEKDIEILNLPWKKFKNHSVGARRRLAQLGDTLFLRLDGTLGDPLGRPYSGDDQIHLGLHPKGRFALVVPTPQCQLESLESQKIMQIVSKWGTDNKIPVYLRKNHSGVLRHLIIREGKNTGERLVNLITTEGLSEIDSLAEGLKESKIPITTFLWTVNSGLSDVAQGEVKKIYWGNGVIQEKTGGVKLNVTPTSFMQTNTHAAEKMILLLKNWINEDGATGTLFDLYCGCGPLALNLAGSFENVVGIELNPNSIEDAKVNARMNGITNTEFMAGRVEDHLDMIKGEKATIIADPARPGLHKDVIARLLAVEAPLIYYVSCNPVALSRDLRLLQAKYRISDVQPMDFFPHTDHVETAVRLKFKS